MATGKKVMDEVRKAQAEALRKAFPAQAPAPAPATLPASPPVVSPDLKRLEDTYLAAVQTSKDAYRVSVNTSEDGGASYDLYITAYDAKCDAKTAWQDAIYEHERATEQARQDPKDAQEAEAQVETALTEKAWANEEARQASRRVFARRNLEQEVVARHIAEQRAHKAVRAVEKIRASRLDQVALTEALVEKAISEIEIVE